MVNGILSGNTANIGNEIVNDASTVAFQNTLVVGGIGGPNVQNFGGGSTVDNGGNLGSAPLFVDVAAPAGADGTYGTPDDGLLLQPTSPAVDAGDGSVLPSGVTTDVLDHSRTQDSNGDGTATLSLGAYETLGNPPDASLQLVLNGTAGQGNDTGWRILSLPYESTTADALRLDHANGTSPPRIAEGVLQVWDDDAGSGITGDYVEAIASTTLERGQGFLFYVADDNVAPVDLTLTFTVNDGSAVPQLPDEVSVSGLATSAQWHLVANPHPTSYALAAMRSNGQSLPMAGFGANVQIYDATQQAWQLVDLRSTAVAPWQGFFIERTTLGSGQTSVTFQPEGRTQDAPFIGTQGMSMSTSPQDATLGLRLQTVEDSPVAAQDDAVAIRFNTHATPEWDAWDASKLDPLSETAAVLAPLGTVRSGETGRKAVESRPWPDADGAPRSIPLQLNATEDLIGRTLSVSVRQWDLPDTWTATLTDTRGTPSSDDDITVPLDPAQGYTFTLNDVLPDPSRFYLTVDPDEGALPVELVALDAHWEDEGVRLQWQTASESGNTGFEVQRASSENADRKSVV